MNRPLLGRISGFLFAFAAIGFGLLFAYSAVSFPVGRFLPSFQWEYALKNGFLLFVEALLPLCAAAIAVAASLAGSSPARHAAGVPAQPFSRTAGSTIIAFILITVAYTVLFEASAPAARRRLSEMQYQSTLAREFKARAEQARKDGDWAEARDELALYLAIDKGNKSMTALKLEAEEEAARRKPTPAKPVPAREPPTEVDAAAYVEKARYYLDREDWFSAHYYASQAAAFDPKRTDAPRLAARAWQKIAGGELRAKDDKAAAVFREKRDAYMLLQKDPVAAYYRFVELSSRFPKDSDVQEYLAESTRKLKESSFFRDEVEHLVALPGAEDVLFFNGAGKDITEAVFIGKLVDAGREGAYALDIEAIRYRSTGEVLWHLRAPYGRIEESAAGSVPAGAGGADGMSAGGRAILLLCVDRVDRGRQIGPVYLAGSRPPAERNILTLAPTVPELEALAVGRDSVGAMGLPQLWRLRERLAAFGMPRERLETEIVMKAFMPFAFLVLAFFALSFGWALRARYLGRPPLLAILFVPIVPIAAALASLLYVHGHRIVLGFTVLAFGLTAALIVGAVLSLALLIVALVLTAGQAA